MKDVEQAALLRNRNTSSGKNEQKSTLPPLPEPFLKARQPITIIYRVSLIGGLLYFLHTANVFATVLYGPKISHGWLKIGMASSVAIQMIKGYIELYDGKSKKQKIEYKNYRHETHAILALFLVASVSFNCALWAEFGGFKTMGILVLFGTVLLQTALLFPTWLQNLLGIAIMTFILQQYQ